MLKVQEFLRGGGTLQQLRERYALMEKRHGEHPNLVLLKYHQIESPFGERIVQECRGIILDEADDWLVVAHSFDKFFNHGEGHAAKIDWSTARVQEKIDGSLLRLYHYAGRWHVATSGTPDANTPCQQGGTVLGKPIATFADLFWTLYHDGVAAGTLPALSTLATNLTYTFEGCAHLNRVVVQHTVPSLTMIGVRDRNTLQEHRVADWSDRFPVVRSYPLQSIDDVVAACRNMDPIKQEGFVVVDREFRRVKVKSPAYVALHHLKDGFGGRRILEIVRSNESSEFLVHFPEWTEDFNRTKAAYETLVEELALLYANATAEVHELGRLVALTPQRAQKEFALRVAKNRASGTLFYLRKTAVDPADSFRAIRAHLVEMEIRSLMSVLGLSNRGLAEE